MSFSNYVSYAKALGAGLKQRRCWRDGRGVMHSLTPEIKWSRELNRAIIAAWHTRCGYPRRSTVEHSPDSHITCLECLTAHTAEYQL